MAYCSQVLDQSYPAEVHSRDHTGEGSNHRTEAAAGSPLDQMGIGHDFEAAHLDQGVAEDQGEKRSIFPLSIASSTSLFPR
jgi:hypothetical protein